MKYHRRVGRYVYANRDPEPLDVFIGRLYDAAHELVEPTIDASNGWELEVCGWLPMNQAQREAADRAAERAKAAAATRKAKKEAKELAEYERLKAKFGGAA